jgi:thioredoxin reductase (NADPH)
MSPAVEDVVVVGSGPAGYTAALYAARADLRPLVVEGFEWGGLLQGTTEVEKYPGFPGGGIAGPELMQRLRDQAEDFGTRFVGDRATRLDLATEPGGVHRVHVGDVVHEARAVILSMGAEHRKLHVPGEDELAGAGVSYCATCDGAFFRDQVILVVGGGDSAFEEAIFLARFGRRVVLVHRRDAFRASRIMEARARSIENLELRTPFEVEAFLPGDGPFRRIARLRHSETGATEDVAVGGAFVAIGHEPQSAIVAGSVDLDDDGYVLVDGASTRTSRPGVFAAGDLVDHTYRQAITAAGTGCRAALDAERYLRDTAAADGPDGRSVDLASTGASA